MEYNANKLYPIGRELIGDREGNCYQGNSTQTKSPVWRCVMLTATLSGDTQNAEPACCQMEEVPSEMSSLNLNKYLL
ncbi:hypothetical protein NQZ68_022154 [Dissostichus eleginoides]|nr:hypothetical protein NQZ68_022154 [Dissostichus eleginoides]